VSAAEGVRISRCAASVLEICAARGGDDALRAHALGQGLEWPGVGRAAAGAQQLVVCVRPARWLLLEPPGSDAARAERLRSWSAAAGAVVDLSAGLAALCMQGARVPDVLARGCRLDLDPRVFAPGHAAATIIAQVPVTLASLPAGLLLLTPASTARHVVDWINTAARPFGLMPQSSISVAGLCRSSMS